MSTAEPVVLTPMPTIGTIMSFTPVTSGVVDVRTFADPHCARPLPLIGYAVIVDNIQPAADGTEYDYLTGIYPVVLFGGRPLDLLTWAVQSWAVRR